MEQDKIRLFNTYSILGTIVLNTLSQLRRYDDVKTSDKVKMIFARIKNKAYENMEDK